jgi:DNA-binding GntR family transcriptional regulator
MCPTNVLRKVDASLSLKDKAYAAIKEAILALELEPGTPLVETDLARQLGISKTPVRDALQELEREGFVIRVPFKGTYVTDVTLKDMQEVFQLRAVLEGLAARLVAQFFTDAELEQLAEVLAAAEAALAQGDLALCSEQGRKIHRTIIDKADNERLILIMRNLDDHIRRFRVLSDRINGRLGRSVREHRRVLEALYKRDADAAEEAVRGHLFSVLQDLSTSGELANEGYHEA